MTEAKYARKSLVAKAGLFSERRRRSRCESTTGGTPRSRRSRPYNRPLLQSNEEPLRRPRTTFPITRSVILTLQSVVAEQTLNWLAQSEKVLGPSPSVCILLCHDICVYITIPSLQLSNIPPIHKTQNPVSHYVSIYVSCREKYCKPCKNPTKRKSSVRHGTSSHVSKRPLSSLGYSEALGRFGVSKRHL